MNKMEIGGYMVKGGDTYTVIDKVGIYFVVRKEFDQTLYLSTGYHGQMWALWF